MSRGVEDTREIPKNKVANGKMVENGDMSAGINEKNGEKYSQMLAEFIYPYKQPW